MVGRLNRKHPLAHNMMAWWRPSIDTTSSMILDLTGYGNHFGNGRGTIGNGVTFVPDPNTSSMGVHFDGTQGCELSWDESRTSLRMTWSRSDTGEKTVEDGWTYCAWMTIANNSGNKTAMGRAYNSGHTSPWFAWSVFCNSSNLQVRQGNHALSRSNFWSTGSSHFGTGWRFVTVLMDNNTGSSSTNGSLRSYRDAGDEASSSTSNWKNAKPEDRANDFLFGQNTAGSEVWNGNISNPMLFNRALTTDEISYLFIESQRGYPNLLIDPEPIPPHLFQSAPAGAPSLPPRRGRTGIVSTP